MFLAYSDYFTADTVLGPPDQYPAVGAAGNWQSFGPYPEYLEVSTPKYGHPDSTLYVIKETGNAHSQKK